MAEDLKPVPMRPNESAEPIPLRHATLRSIVDKGESYVASLHSEGTDREAGLVVDKVGKYAQVSKPRQVSASASKKASPDVEYLFAKGDEVIDTDTGRAAVVVDDRYGYTRKTHTPVYKVSNGKRSWTQRQNRLSQKRT